MIRALGIVLAVAVWGVLGGYVVYPLVGQWAYTAMSVVVGGSVGFWASRRILR